MFVGLSFYVISCHLLRYTLFVILGVREYKLIQEQKKQIRHEGGEEGPRDVLVRLNSIRSNFTFEDTPEMIS